MKIPHGWKLKSVEDMFEVQLGKMLNQAAKNGGEQYPYLTNTNVQWGRFDLAELNTMTFSETEKKKFSLKNGDLIVCEGGEVGRCSVWREEKNPCYYQKALHRLRPLNGEEILPEFMLAYMQSIAGTKRLGDLTSRSSIAHLTREKFLELDVFVPPIKEQRKLILILGSADDGIEKLAALIVAKAERKRGLMQQLLTGQTRFKEFKGERWRKVGLSEILEQVTRKNSTGCVRVLTGSANHGLIDQREFYSRRVASDDVSGYYLVKRGEFAYNRSSAAGYPFGATKRLNDYDEGVLSTLYLVFRIKSGAPLDSNFLEHLFEGGFFDAQLSRLCREGARSHGLLNITADEFFSMHMHLPSVAEQQRIEAVLSACDREIELLEKQLEALKEQKRGLMQKLLTGVVRVKI